MINRQTVFSGIAAMATLLVTVATVVVAAEQLGWSGMLPVTRDALITHVGAADRTAEQNDLYWAEQFRQQLYQNEFALEQWKAANPNQPPPPVFGQQRSNLTGRINQLEAPKVDK